MLKNRIRVLLAKAGRTVEARDLFGVGGMRELEGLDLGAARTAMVRGRLAVARQAGAAVQEAEERMEAQVDRSPQARRVDSIKGFGPLSALTVAAEIGDLERFSRAGKLVSYAGLAPAGAARH